ncbi:unnamed protein product [Rhodiola kirilowii]
MDSYYNREPWDEEEFSPPSFQCEIREKIMYIEQSRDETLDEYLWYFDSIVTSCPHHGFTNLDLIQRFLGGMMPHEWDRLNEAAGGSVYDLTISDIWELINVLAESSRPQQEQTEPLEDDVEELAASIQQLADMMEQYQAETEEDLTEIREKLSDLNQTVSELRRDRREEDGTKTVVDMEEALIEPILEPMEPSKDEDPTTPKGEPAETSHDLITNLSEEGRDLIAKTPLLDSSLSVCMPTITPEDEGIINDEVQGRLEEKQEQGRPILGKSLAISQQGSRENSLILKRPFLLATKTRVNMGTCLIPLVRDGKIVNIQNCKDAIRSYLKKRPRHGMFQWKPGWRSTRARHDGPAAMVKRSSPTRRDVKAKPPDQWKGEPSPLPHKFFGQIVRAVEAKFDLTRPWDPNL